MVSSRSRKRVAGSGLYVHVSPPKVFAPASMSKLAKLNDAVNANAINDIKTILNEEVNPKQRLQFALHQDQYGTTLLHKSLYNGLSELSKWLIDQFPQLVNMKDQMGRNPGFFTVFCKDYKDLQRMLSINGADIHTVDITGRTVRYYMEHPNELELANGNTNKMAMTNLQSLKPSTIRIWIHQRDLSSLQQALWDGNGHLLLREHSNNPKMKRFLENVPVLMNVIKAVHQSATTNDLQTIETLSPPPIVFSAKDSNGLTALHKASGLGYLPLVDHIIQQYPESVHQIDKGGRTALHWSILGKNDDVYSTLIEHGIEEGTLDLKGKTALYYRTRPTELDSRLLTKIPDAPRIAKETLPPKDWGILLENINKVNGIVNDKQERQEISEEKQETNKETETKQEAVQNEIINEIKEETENENEQIQLEVNEENDEENNEGNIIHEPVSEVEIEEENEQSVEQENENEEKNNENEEENNETDEATEEALDKNEEQMDETEEKGDENEETIDDVEEKGDENEDVVEAQNVESDSEGVIEGLINGDEDLDNNDENDDIQAAIDNNDMEKLADMVLNGEGGRLVNRKARGEEVQAFIDNIPTYMQKIRSVHLSARNGDLRELQSALDRRKFALARDLVSPNGATPLHVATLFHHLPIIRYLAGRFPETLLEKDNEGRTALHYAAVIDDELFHLLIGLGAKDDTEDKFGHKAEYYQATNNDDFNRAVLLRRFGENEEENNDPPNSQIALFQTEEGRYLATSLGDPLIKGLTLVANNRPDDPVAYLAEYLNSYKNNNKEKRMQAIDVVTIDPKTEETSDSDETVTSNPIARDEHGQSMLHFAAARAHGRSALFELLRESGSALALRDELYRTPRDISVQANARDNTMEIDRYVISLASQNQTSSLLSLLLEGYDHIVDLVDEDGESIAQSDVQSFLESITAFEQRRERVHHAVRLGQLDQLQELLTASPDAHLLSIAKNSYARTALHIAVLRQNIEIVTYLANAFPAVLAIGDNLERTALHYAMAVDRVDELSAILVSSGANRVAKDLKGRQPSYYYMNKADILRLQEEEETF